MSVESRLEGENRGWFRMRWVHVLRDERDCRLWWCRVAGEDGLKAVSGG